jgi:hypothetical protein
LQEVFGHYGIEMSKEAARRKARKIRRDRGWTGAEPPPDSEPAALRLVS